MKIEEINEYEVIKHQNIAEVNSDGWLLKHKKTGARVVILANDDENKVFDIAFRTPVTDNTGVPHIIEHTVLCGSDKYPVKDPFMELAKGSLNTFLNAMTYPDKTVYPVASCNDKDFKNLMNVYMDAVFHPNIYNEEKIFKQEGWHYELDSKDGELTYNGIVYNEMKGVYSSVDGIIDRVGLQSLYPDTGYAKESGGEPEFIPELTYEDYLDFHRRYYHPSNSYIYMYGNMDVVERLEWIDKEYLSKYERLEIDSTVKKQAAFDAPVELEKDYAISDSEDTENNTVFTANYVIGDSLDARLNIAFQIIEYAIMQAPGAPLKQALIDAEIGKDVSGQYEDDICQPMYSIVVKYANKDSKDKFLKTIKDTLKEIVNNGLDKDTLSAGLNSLEFRIKEADYGMYPKGLIWGLQLYSSWLYDENEPFVLLETNKIFDDLKNLIGTDYFEKTIERYLLNNMHQSIVTFVPKKGLTAAQENALAQKLADKKAKMSDEEIERLIVETKELKEYQEEASPKEALECIPLLAISDIEPEPRAIINQEERIDNTPIVYHDLYTNGIAYMDIVYDCSDIPKKYHPYMGLLKSVLSYMDTEKRGYGALNTDIDNHLGGFAFTTGIYTNYKENKNIFTVEIHSKMFYEQIEKAFSLIEEIVCETVFDDDKRLKDILDELKSRIQSSIVQSGDSAAMLRAMSYYSEVYYLKEETSGISFYDFVKDILGDFEANKSEIISMLKETMRYVFRPERMILNYAGNKESYEKVKCLMFELKHKMYNTPIEKSDWKFVPEQKNEGFKTSGQVQYVARTGSYKNGSKVPYNGSFNVLGSIMRRGYLWDNIRVLGGAYGCNAFFTRMGDVMFTSYRDPNLRKTSHTFLNAIDFIENYDASDREMTKYIIGTISSIDRPLGASDQSSRDFSTFISGIDYDTLKRERREILSTTASDIRKMAPLVKKAMNQNNICVVGSQSSIDEAEELFKETKDLV